MKIMKHTLQKILSLVMLMSASLALTAFAQDATPGYNHKIPEKIMTPDKVQTRIGTLEFFDGMPTKATVTKVYVNLDLMRGTEAFLNGIPAANMEALLAGSVALGVNSCNKVVIFDKLLDSAGLSQVFRSGPLQCD